MRPIFILALIICSSSWIFGQDAVQSYTGQESREIKSLSLEDVSGYLQGRGMGFAKAAELNHYPGPKHVLELKEKLNLSKEQVEQTQSIYDEMHKKAIRLGILFVEKEKFLDDLFINQSIDSKKLQTSVSEMGQLRGEIRLAHLAAHLKMKQVLTTEQTAKYDKLRGYANGQSKHEHHRQH